MHRFPPSKVAHRAITVVMESQESGADQCRGATASITQSTQLTARPSIFLLPPEIRREVFQHLLVNKNATIEPKVDPGTKASNWKFWIDWHNETSLAILRTCRMIYEEASKILYENNTFRYECRWNDQGVCRTFGYLPNIPKLKSIKHLQLDIYRFIGSSYILPVNIESTLKSIKAFGFSLSTLRLNFTPTYRKVLPLEPSEFQTEVKVMEKIVNQLCRIRIRKKIEIEFAAWPEWKADSEQISGFIDAIVAKKNWVSRKTTIVSCRCRLKKWDDIGTGIPIDLPVQDVGREKLVAIQSPVFSIAYGETDKIVVDEDKIASYRWRWLLQEKI